MTIQVYRNGCHECGIAMRSAYGNLILALIEVDHKEVVIGKPGNMQAVGITKKKDIPPEDKCDNCVKIKRKFIELMNNPRPVWMHL